MFCPKCGAQIEDNARFCGHCGAKIVPVAEEQTAVPAEPQPEPIPVYTPAPEPQPQPQPAQTYYANAQPQGYANQGYNYNSQSYASPGPLTLQDIPSEYRPIGPWKFFWLQILYTIPIVGFIFIIINSIRRDNYCKRNHARSYLFMIIISAAVSLFVSILMGIIFAIRG